jgi:hypothetical protein
MKIKKSQLITFISKYSLGGTVEAVKFVAKTGDSSLNVGCISEEKSFLGKIQMLNFAATEDLEIGIHETSKLKNLLGVLGEDIDLDPVKADDGRVVSLVISDADTQVAFSTADLDVIPAVPNLKTLPPFSVEITVDKDFSTKFIKSKNALSDVDSFTIVPGKDKKVSLILGYNATINTNRVTMTIKTAAGKDTLDRAISFSAKHFKEILAANSEVDATTLFIAEKGLAYVKFEKGDYKAEYFMPEVAQK